MMYQHEMIEAAKTPSVLSMTQRAAAEAVRIVVHKAYELKGVEPLEKDVEVSVVDILGEVAGRYRAMTTGEIALALKYGIAENFGKDTRPTSGNFLLWMERYMSSPDRAEAINAAQYAARKEQERLEDNYEERERKRAAFVQDAPRREWEKYKELGRLDITIDGYAAAVYDALVERGKLNATEPTKAKAREIAQAQLRQEAQRRKGISSAIAAGLEFGHGEDYRTKKVLLGWYFENLRKRGIDLN